MPKADDTAVKDDVVADTTTTDPATAETKESDVVSDPLSDDAFDDIDEEVAKETDDSGEDDDEAKTPESETPDADETDKPQDGDIESDKPLAPKSQNRFQQLAHDNRELRAEIERLKSQDTQVATEQGLLDEINPNTGEYYTPQEAERIARQQALEQSRQALAQESYGLQVKQTQELVSNEVSQVLEMPVFKGDSDESKGLIAEYENILSDNLIYQAQDGNNYTARQLMDAGVNLETQATLVGANVSPLKLANLVTKATQINSAKNQAEAQRSVAQQLANADIPSGVANKQTKDETSDFDEAWDE